MMSLLIVFDFVAVLVWIKLLLHIIQLCTLYVVQLLVSRVRKYKTNGPGPATKEGAAGGESTYIRAIYLLKQKQNICKLSASFFYFRSVNNLEINAFLIELFPIFQKQYDFFLSSFVCIQMCFAQSNYNATFECKFNMMTQNITHSLIR